MEKLSTNTENARKSVRGLIEMAWQHIDNNLGGGTCQNLLKLYDEYFDAMDENFMYETEESNWRFDLAKNNVHKELQRGLRIG